MPAGLLAMTSLPTLPALKKCIPRASPLDTPLHGCAICLAKWPIATSVAVDRLRRSSHAKGGALCNPIGWRVEGRALACF
jgi:hypothetical protein